MDKLKELKAAAYDAMVQVQEWQKTLNAINDEIANYRPPQEEQVINMNNKDNGKNSAQHKGNR